MKVFISWSGNRSKLVAETFRQWLSKVLQMAEPWISSDIEKGTRWSKEILEKLEESRFGIIVLTSSNLNSPWILFEAGALSKTNDAHVCTFLLDVSPSDIEQPLAQFQHTTTSKEDIKKLLIAINTMILKSGEKGLTEIVLNDVFETNWPNLEQKIANIRKMYSDTRRPNRSQKDMMSEILEYVRPLPVQMAALQQVVSQKSSSKSRFGAMLEYSKEERLINAIESLNRLLEMGAGEATLKTKLSEIKKEKDAVDGLLKTAAPNENA